MEADPGELDESPDDAFARYGTDFVRYGKALAEGIEATIAGWVVRSVEQRMTEWSGGVPDEVRAMAEAAGERARVTVGAEVADALALDLDDQRVPPLQIVRRAVVHPTGVLEAAGVPHVVRDEIDEAMFPEDVYALAPASFADVDPSLHEPGLAWGAAKAYVHLARRRADGQR